MRRFTAFLAAPLLFAICTSMAAEDNKASSLQYFPSAKGTHWVYQTTKKAAKDKFPMDVTIEGSWKEAGKSGYVMTQKDKRGRMKEYLLEDREKGISIYKLALKRASCRKSIRGSLRQCRASFFRSFPGQKFIGRVD